MNGKICYTDIPKHHLFLIRKYLKLELTKLIKGGYCFFGSGGALGFDTEVSLAILELKKESPHIKLILVYGSILKQADKVRYTSQNYALSQNIRVINIGNIIQRDEGF